MATIERSVDVTAQDGGGFSGYNILGGMAQRLRAWVHDRVLTVDIALSAAERAAARDAIAAGQPVTVLVTITKV